MKGLHRARAIVPGAVLVVALAALGVAGNAVPDSDYFGRTDPTWVRVPATAGDPVYVGVAVLNPAAGATIELVSVVAGSTEGAVTVEGLFSVLRGETRLIGAVAASDVPAEIDLRRYQPLAGLRIGASDGPVALVVRVTGSGPRYGFTELVLRFRVDGGELEVDRFPLRATVCTGETRDQAVEGCHEAYGSGVPRQELTGAAAAGMRPARTLSKQELQ